MKKKGYLSVEAILIGASILVLAAFVAGTIVATTNGTLNGISNMANNAVVNP